MESYVAVENGLGNDIDNIDKTHADEDSYSMVIDTDAKGELKSPYSKDGSCKTKNALYQDTKGEVKSEEYTHINEGNVSCFEKSGRRHNVIMSTDTQKKFPGISTSTATEINLNVEHKENNNLIGKILDIHRQKGELPKMTSVDIENMLSLDFGDMGLSKNKKELPVPGVNVYNPRGKLEMSSSDYMLNKEAKYPASHGEYDGYSVFTKNT